MLHPVGAASMLRSVDTRYEEPRRSRDAKRERRRRGGYQEQLEASGVEDDSEAIGPPSDTAEIPKGRFVRISV